MNINSCAYTYIMEGIYEATSSFDFNQLKLISPMSMSGGNYFIKFRIQQQPLYIQPPQCILKNGVQKSGKKLFSDLVFTHENEDFIQWIENLETHCKKQIFENRTKWFETELEEADIETFLTSPVKIYKSGKNYVLRTNIPTLLGNCTLKVYNQNEEEIGIDNLKENDIIVSVLEFQGIKCSPRNFQIDIEIKQMMVISPPPLFEKCVFTPNKKQSNSESTYEITHDVKSSGDSLKQTTNETIQIYEDPNINETRQYNEYENNTLLKDIHTPINSGSLHESANTELKTLDSDNEKHLEENPKRQEGDLEEVEFNLDELSEENSIQLKKRDNVFYDMYKEAKRKAKLARDLAISAYLDAQNIKQTYMLDDIEDSDSDLDESDFEKINLF
jgi:hypothetical protein